MTISPKPNLAVPMKAAGGVFNSIDRDVPVVGPIDDFNVTVGSTTWSATWTATGEAVSIQIRDVTASGVYAEAATATGVATSASGGSLTPANDYQFRAVTSAGVSNVVARTTSAAPSSSVDGITVTGTIAHGEEITVTDTESRFGTRTNIKPLFVNFGDTRNGSPLGRDTGDYWVSIASISADQSLGSITQTVKRDYSTDTYQNSSFGGMPFIFNNERTPCVQYIERYYDFFNDMAATNGSLNLKTNRWWGTDLSYPNCFSGYGMGGTETAGAIRMYVELVDQGAGHLSTYYPETRPFQGKTWQSDEYIIVQSSDVGVDDGHLIHIWNGEEINFFRDNWITRDTNMPDLMTEIHLDQISDGVGEGVVIYFGYQCVDTEYNGVYVGNAPTRAECTKLVRQPQTAWALGQIKFQGVETHVPLAYSYLYFRTGMRSWISDDGVQIGAQS